MKYENILWSYSLYKGLSGILWSTMIELFHRSEGFTFVYAYYVTEKKTQTQPGGTDF